MWSEKISSFFAIRWVERAKRDERALFFCHSTFITSPQSMPVRTRMVSSLECNELGHQLGCGLDPCGFSYAVPTIATQIWVSMSMATTAIKGQ